VTDERRAFTPTIQDIVRELDAHEHHTSASLAAALRRPITIDDVAAWIRFDPNNYVRSLVTSTERWELRLLCWRPWQSSSLHGHGSSACAFRVLRGSATESILGERDRTWAPGDVVQESSSGLVHQVSNAGADALLTLHAYSPRIPIDAPSTPDGRSVVIVGGGVSGIALAIHLLRSGDPKLRITVVERGPWLGRGVAYGVDSEVFRLNVPAAKMSLDPEQPDDFARWAGVTSTPNVFLQRTHYGRYVVQRFGEALRSSPAKLRIVRGEVAQVGESSVVLVDGRRIAADTVVLATGLSPRIGESMFPADPRIIDAWDECALAALPRDGRLLILGSGLTALDVVAFMSVHGFRGTASIVSRRGLLPRPHVPPGTSVALPAELLEEAPADLRELLRWGRRVVAEATRRGAPWQHAIDAMRPHVSRLWRNLPPGDRARFVRSVRPYWDVLRHRAPQDAHERIDAWRSQGRLELVAGGIAGCVPTASGLEVVLRLRDGTVRKERYDAIVRCIGPALERAESDAPIVHDLIEQGRAAADPAGLGIVTDHEGRVIGPDGRPSERLYALGALRRASSWETTAVPDISVHALALARKIAG